jgi:hypothetical protein
MKVAIYEDMRRMMRDPVVVAMARSLPRDFVFQADFSNIVAADDEYLRRGGTARGQTGSVALAMVELRAMKR